MCQRLQSLTLEIMRNYFLNSCSSKIEFCLDFCSNEKISMRLLSVFFPLVEIVKFHVMIGLLHTM